MFFDSKLERYAVSDKKGNISVGHAGTGQEIVALPGTGEYAWRLLFSPDSEHLAVDYHLDDSLQRNRLVVWDLARGKKVLDLLRPMPWPGMHFSPDGRLLAVGREDKSVRLLDTTTYQEVGRLAVSVVPRELQFDPQGRRLAVCGYSENVDIRDITTGKLIRVLPCVQPEHPSWHPDGELFACSLNRSFIYLWNASTGVVERSIDAHPRTDIHSLTFNHTGDLLASAAWDGRVALWDTYGGIRHIGVEGVVTCGATQVLQFSPDDRFLGYNLKGSRIQLWEVIRPEGCLQLFGTGGTDVSFHPEGQIVAAVGYDGVRLWDVMHAKPLTYLPSSRWGTNSCAEFHPDGKSLIAGGAQLTRWPLQASHSDQAQHFEIGPREILWNAPAVYSTAISADGKSLAATSYNGTAVIIQGNDRQRRLLVEHRGTNKITISPDARWIVTGTFKGSSLRFWDGKTGELARELSGEQFYGSAPLQFSPDGQWLVTRLNDGFHVWDVKTWNRAHPIDSDQISRGFTAAFSPDGQLLAISATRYTVRLIDWATRDEIATLEPPNRENVEALQFSQDGTRLGVSAAGVLQVWDLRTLRRELAKMGLDWNLPAYKGGDESSPNIHQSNDKSVTITLARGSASQGTNASASSNWDSHNFDVTKVVDGELFTRWSSRENDTEGAWLAVSWNAPVKVQAAVVREAFDRIAGFKLQSWNEGAGEWKDIYAADGEQVRALKGGPYLGNPFDPTRNPVLEIELPEPVETTRLRLLITSVVPITKGAVTIWEFEAYDPQTWSRLKLAP